jgi:hypothetical protein
MAIDRRVVWCGLALGLMACGTETDEDDVVADALEVAGTWQSMWGSEEIGAQVGDAWGSATLIEFDNEAKYAILQNPPDAEWNPDAYSRVVWTEPEDGSFFYCTVAFGLETLEEARESTATADATDPESGGCGDFEWTRLDAPPDGEGG